MSKLRTFLGIELPLDIKCAISALMKNLANQPNTDKIKWVSADNLHITLVFLGNIDEQLIPTLSYKILLAVEHIKNFNLVITSEILVFNHQQRIFSLAVTSQPPLITLVDGLKKACDEINIATEKRPYVPHITLGRAPKSVQLNAIDSKQILSLAVKKITLFESRSSLTGVHYFPIHYYPLT